MAKALVIVESPAKAKTITKFLGRGFVVRASMGHVRDLPKSKFGVDIESGFKPDYITIRGKGDVVKELREAAKKADRILLATDPDREGEAISWHLGHLLDVDTSAPCRIEFHEVTQRAITQAVKSARPVDMNLVDSQQTRRILDRIVGYQLSPLLWQKVRRGLSAGRVQSVAVRLICDRAKEIADFRPEEYWSITASLAKKKGERPFLAKLVEYEGTKASIGDQAGATAVLKSLEGARYQVVDVKRKERFRHPAAPFTTSTLQQEASRKLGFGARKTMQIAQQLYEGLEVAGEGAVGLITYMRTDSVRVASEAQAEARSYIMEHFGKASLPDKPPFYKTRASAQGAHEAVRPTSLLRTPDTLRASLKRDQLRLYELIWRRFLASQMNPAVLDTVAADIAAGAATFRATGSVVKFPGFMQVYTEGRDDEGGEESETLPELSNGETLHFLGLEPKQHFTQPPPAYTEAMLVRAMEELGIGRPSTYAPTIETIQDRGYVHLANRRFEPTELGCLVVDLMKEYFPDIINIEFTADLESKLDGVESGEIDGRQILQGFYGQFSEELANAKEKMGKVKIADEESDVVCDLCGRRMVIKQGRFGKFLACPGFPDCRNTKPIRKELEVACPECAGQIVERRTRKGKVFFGCANYPKCTFTSWNEPVNQKCPRCGKLMVKKRRGKVETLSCIDPYCGRARKPDDGEAPVRIAKTTAAGAKKAGAKAPAGDAKKTRAKRAVAGAKNTAAKNASAGAKKTAAKRKGSGTTSAANRSRRRTSGE